MSDDQQLVVVSSVGGVALVRLNRPQVRNAINDPMQDRLIRLLDDLAADASIRALVVTGEGKAFCAGGDISGMQRRLASRADHVAVNGLRRLRRTRQLIDTLHGMDKVTIAAVNGSANGVGMDLALCCDFIVASPEAQFAMSYVKVGLVPDGGGLYFLPRRVGLAQAKQLIFTGRTVEVAEALQLGLVDRVVPAADLVATATGWAEELTVGSAAAIGLAKPVLDASFDLTLDEVFARSHGAQSICYTTEAHRVLVASFLHRPKRQPTSSAATGSNRSTE